MTIRDICLADWVAMLQADGPAPVWQASWGAGTVKFGGVAPLQSAINAGCIISARRSALHGAQAIALAEREVTAR